MTYLGYAALAALILATLVTFVRSYRPIRDGKIGRRLMDLGLTLILLFVTLMLATYMSVTASALVAGSSVIMMVLGLVGATGVLLLIAAAFHESWSRSLQAWRYKRDTRKMAKWSDEEADEAHDPRFVHH